jgi:hypothetical protein
MRGFRIPRYCSWRQEGGSRAAPTKIGTRRCRQDRGQIQDRHAAVSLTNMVVIKTVGAESQRDTCCRIATSKLPARELAAL